MERGPDWPTGIASLRSTALRWCRYACVLSGIAGCALDERPVNGGLVLLVESDLATPKDIDQLRIDVSQGTETLLRVDTTLGAGAAALPREFRVPASKDRSPAIIRATAFKDGEARIERSVITVIPSAHQGLLRLPLQFLCAGFVAEGGASSCGAEQTCKQGQCESALHEADPPDYREQPNKAARSDAGSYQSNCFDVSACFEQTSEVQLADEACAFELGERGSEQVNVALRLPLGSDGVCDERACWIVLNKGEDGFRVDGGELVLPSGVCEWSRDHAGSLVVSELCAAKTGELGVCGPHDEPPDDQPMTRPDVTPGVDMFPVVGDACAGPALRSCGRCGSSLRTCQNGTWSGFSECTNEGVCNPEASESCGSGGTRSCGGDCAWGACENQRCQGPTTRACGRCGTQQRECRNGVFGAWSGCSGEGACTPGTTEACGTNGTRACGGDCSWGRCGEQSCEGAPTEACGSRCGTRQRTCNAGAWSEWSECAAGECSPNEVRACGSGGTQTCGGDCRWAPGCSGQVCSGNATRACDRCGTQARTCNPNTGRWSEWSACTGEGACAPDSTRSCGENGIQTCAGNCQWNDACTGQLCLGESTRSCGHCGRQTRRCDTSSGAWLAWSACTGEGECEPGETRMCGSDGIQTCQRDCRWTASCSGQSCAGANSRSCGNCGVQTRSCDSNTGRWSSWTSCTGQGVCSPGEFAQRDCGPAGGRTCSGSCEWNACACAPGYESCAGSGCVHLASDAAHCGSCGISCGPEQSCENARCTCPGALALCDDACVDLQADAEHCGTCENACGGGKLCQLGKCVCPPGLAECNGTCVDLTRNAAHCSACALACGLGRVCEASACRCAAGTTDCGAGCVDTRSDPKHCGPSCMACPTGASCVQGQCACPAGMNVCNGACVDTRANDRQCGASCMPCPTGTTCVQGQCACPANTTACGMGCVDTRSDPKHCGACNRACSAGTQCSAAGCVCPDLRPPCGTACCADSETCEAGRCVRFADAGA